MARKSRLANILSCFFFIRLILAGFLICNAKMKQKTSKTIQIQRSTIKQKFTIAFQNSMPKKSSFRQIYLVYLPQMWLEKGVVKHFLPAGRLRFSLRFRPSSSRFLPSWLASLPPLSLGLVSSWCRSGPVSAKVWSLCRFLQ